MKEILCLLAFAAAAPVHAAEYAGASSFDFLNLDAGARAVALGGAYTAVAGGADSLLYNPAGLARLRTEEATFMHDQFVQGLTQDYLAVATSRGFGANVNYAHVGDIARTRADAPDGTLGTFGAGDLAVAGGYGFSLFDRSLSLGAGIKYLHETLADVSATGEAVDAGLLYSPPAASGLTLGASMLNVGPAVKFVSSSSPLPATARLGASYAFKLLGAADTLAFDVSRQREDRLRWGVGLETVVARLMALRLGLTSRNDAGLGLTGGVGWAWSSVSVDYAFSPYGDLGLAQRLSVTLRWGGERPDPRAGRAAEPVHVALAAPIPEEPRLQGVAEQARLHEQLADAAFEKRSYSDAKAHYVEALRLAATIGLSDSGIADAYAGVGFCLLEQGDAGYGTRFLRKALELGPSERVRRQAELAINRQASR